MVSNGLEVGMLRVEVGVGKVYGVNGVSNGILCGFLYCLVISCMWLFEFKLIKIEKNVKFIVIYG